MRPGENPWKRPEWNADPEEKKKKAKDDTQIDPAFQYSWWQPPPKPEAEPAPDKFKGFSDYLRAVGWLQ